MSKLLTSVLLVGPYSYVGGVSIHMVRLVHILGEDFTFGVLDDSPMRISNSPYRIRRLRSFFSNLRYIARHHIVHIHTGNWILRVAMILVSLALKKRVIVTLHSYRLKGISERITRAVLKHADHVVCVNEIICGRVDAKNKSVKEAFIPPVKKGLGLPYELDKYVNANNDKLILCANAFRLREYEGNDLYGLNQCIDVAEIAKSQQKPIVIIFVVGRVDSSDSLYFTSMKRITEKGLSDYIHVVPYSIDFIELIKRSDIVLRPTLTDGDALTVREAIYLGKPVIASDVIKRPVGTEIYRTADSRNLYDAIMRLHSAFSKGQSLATSKKGGSIEAYKEFYTSVYKSDLPFC